MLSRRADEALSGVNVVSSGEAEELRYVDFWGWSERAERILPVKVAGHVNLRCES